MEANDKSLLKVLIGYLLIVVLLCIIASLTSCNPVKQVLKDDNKKRQVWEQGVLEDWCKSDSVIINKSDTLITFDTLFAIDYETDTFTVDREIVKVKTVVKTIHIRDTTEITKWDTDKEKLLQQEIDKLKAKLASKEQQLKQSQQETKEAIQERNKWLRNFILLAIVFGLFLFRKPLFKLGTKIISPIKF